MYNLKSAMVAAVAVLVVMCMTMDAAHGRGLLSSMMPQLFSNNNNNNLPELPSQSDFANLAPPPSPPSQTNSGPSTATSVSTPDLKMPNPIAMLKNLESQLKDTLVLAKYKAYFMMFPMIIKLNPKILDNDPTMLDVYIHLFKQHPGLRDEYKALLNKHPKLLKAYVDLFQNHPEVTQKSAALRQLEADLKKDYPGSFQQASGTSAPPSTVPPTTDPAAPATTGTGVAGQDS